MRIPVTFTRRARLLAAMVLGFAFIASTARAQALFGGFNTEPAKKPAVSVVAEVRPGTSMTRGMLYVTATVLPGHHIYAIDTPSGAGPVPTEVRVFPSEQFHVGQFRALSVPDTEFSEAFQTEIRTHHGKVAWAAPIEWSSEQSAREIAVKGAVFAQACSKEFCVRPQEYPFVARRVAESPTNAALAGAVPASSDKLDAGLPSPKSRKSAQHNSTETSEVPLLLPAPQASSSLPSATNSAEVSTISFASAKGETTTGQAERQTESEPTVFEQTTSTDASLPWILGVALLGGLLLNLMPCVLPVIGLKVLSFVEQSGHSRARAFWLNAWYSLGLLSVFWILAGLAAFLGFGWGQLFTYGGFNLALAAVVFAMGLSFLGVWEIPIPGFVGSGQMAELGQKEGATGAFAKGMITTVLATPCTAPLLGTALAWALKKPPTDVFLVFTAVGLGMASPYLIAGAFPKVTAFLPKPGSWMETFKQFMGFILLATVVYLLTILKGYYVVPTVGFLFALWAACWWIGKTPLTATTTAKAVRWAQAGMFAALVWFVMFAGSPIGFSSFDEPASFRGLACVMRDRAETNDEWRPFTRDALDAELARGKPVLVDFTADWCLVCKTLEATVLRTESVKSAILKNNVATLQADWTHGDPEVTRMLDHLGSKQVPVIAVFSPATPNRPIIFRGGMTERMLLDALTKAGRS